MTDSPWLLLCFQDHVPPKEKAPNLHGSFDNAASLILPTTGEVRGQEGALMIPPCILLGDCFLRLCYSLDRKKVKLYHCSELLLTALLYDIKGALPGEEGLG